MDMKAQRPNRLTRRAFLGRMMIVPPAIGVLAIGRNAIGDLLTTTTPTPAPTGSATPYSLSCVGTPSATEGPYFVDEMLNRSDIRSDPTDNSVRPGVPLYLAVRVFQVDSTACKPLKGAQVDIWHCDALGAYSDVSGAGQSSTVGKKFLRGYQVSDDAGLTEFVTIYPGWYSGRTVHIHMKVRVPNGTTTYELTSQIFFDDKLSDEIYSTVEPYTQHKGRNVTNAEDSIMNGALDDANLDADDFGETVLIKLSKNTDKDKEGYSGYISVGLDLTQPVPTSSGGNGGGGPGGGGGPRGTPPPRP
jgi:protocatechuate 3,4-dioxygenase beta subunit